MKIFSGEGKGYALQYSGLENSTDCIVHGVAKSWTRLRNFHFHCSYYHSDFGAQENKFCHYFHCFAIYLTWSDGTGNHDLSFWMLSFKPVFSLSSFTFIMRFFSSSSLCAIRLKWQTLFYWAPKITADGDCSHEIETLAPWKKSYDKPGQCIEKQRHHFASRGPSSQSCGFSCGHVWM